jgi:ribosome-associated translation inhibitor RaiA
VERRIRFALTGFSTQVTSVTVRLADLNGPRGGVDKQCRIGVQIIPSGTVALEETNANLYACIDRAAGRAERLVAWKLQRTRDHQLFSRTGEASA